MRVNVSLCQDAIVIEGQNLLVGMQTTHKDTEEGVISDGTLSGRRL